MALTAPQAAAEVAPIVADVKALQNYFADFLTVSTFGGDYLLQKLNKLSAVGTKLTSDTSGSTPDLADAKTVQGPAGLELVNDSLKYYNEYLTVFTFGGDYLFQKLNNIKKHLTNLQTGL